MRISSRFEAGSIRPVSTREPHDVALEELRLSSNKIGAPGAAAPAKPETPSRSSPSCST